MSVNVRFFASFADHVGVREKQIAGKTVQTPRDVWRACNLGVELPANILVAVNKKYADLDSPVNDGDEVAFFPPVTGG